MKNNKGFATIAIIAIVVAVLAVGVGAYYMGKSQKVIYNKDEIKTNPVNSNTESPILEKDVTNQPAYLNVIYTKNNKNYIDVDYVEWLRGEESLKAQVEDGGCISVKDCYDFPNGYKRNRNPKIRTFEVSPTVLINVYGTVGMTLFNDNAITNPPISFSHFLDTISSKNIQKDFITIDVKNNIAVKIIEPYQE